jgi:hypothetical protein
MKRVCSLPYSQQPATQGPVYYFVTPCSYGGKMLNPRPTLNRNPLLAVRDFLFNPFVAIRHI